MTQLEYISKNCIQCAKDLAECHGLVIALHNFAVEAVKGTRVEYVFTDSGVRFVQRERYSDSPLDEDRYVKTCVASIQVFTDNNDKCGEGLVIQIGQYVRFIPRDRFTSVSLDSVFSDVRGYLKLYYSKALAFCVISSLLSFVFAFAVLLGAVL